MAKLISASIEAIQELLSSQGYEAAIQPATDINPSEQLLVAMGKDQEGHDLIIRLFWTQGYQDEEEMNENEPQFLQFFLLFPFLVAEPSLKDVTTLILNLNASFDLANFGLYEDQRLLYYRYVHVHSGQDLDADSILAIMISIQFMLEMLIPSITEVALGKKTLKQVEAESLEKVRKSDLDFL